MLWIKIKIICYKFLFFVKSFPKRVLRFVRFPTQIFKSEKVLHFWLLEWFLLLLDIFGVPEFIESIHELVNWKLRSLSVSERELTFKYFKNSIDVKNIRINAVDNIFSKRMNIAFVSFYTINFYGKISLPTFIHEMVHIWQFENFGSPYIVRSLQAQHSKSGYEYGNIETLKSDILNSRKLLDYNYEQMAEIIKDAYLFDLTQQQKDTANPYDGFLGELTGARSSDMA